MKHESNRKILMLLDNPYPKDERVEKEAQSLASEGFTIHLICFGYGNESEKEFLGGIWVHRIKISKALKGKIHPLIAQWPILYRAIWLKKVLKLIDDEGINLVHAHDLPMCLLGHTIKRRRRIKFIADLHENFPSLIQGMSYRKSLLGRLLVNVKAWYEKEKVWLDNADAILVTAAGMRERLINTGLRDKSYYVIENTIRLDDYDIPHRSPDPEYFTLFYSGGITIHRGLQYILKGMVLLRSKIPNLRLWIVGAGRYERELKVMQEELGLNNITFWGWKSTHEMFELMTQADLCIIPHLKSEHTDNTSPNKIFQYFYANKPVLVSDCNYLVEVITNTGAGNYYKSKSAESFADKLLQLKTESDLQLLAMRGRDAVIQRYNWQLTAQRLNAAYQELEGS